MGWLDRLFGSPSSPPQSSSSTGSNRRNEERTSQGQANAARLESAISALERGHRNLDGRIYKDFWAGTKDVVELFRSLKPLSPDDRERLWSRYSSLCQEVKAEQNRKYEMRGLNSGVYKRDILHEIERARPTATFTLPTPDVLKDLGATLRSAGDMLSRHKHQMTAADKQECFDRIQDVRKDHDIWWEKFKSERSKQSGDGKDRIRRNLEKNHERYRKAKNALERQEQNASKLRDQIASAWNDSFRSRAEGWLAEAEDKIADIRRSIAEIEGWIDEDEGKLRRWRD